MFNLSDWTKRVGKHEAFTVLIRRNERALELGAWCLISETFLYLSGVIYLIAGAFIGEVLRYILLSVIFQIFGYFTTPVQSEESFAILLIHKLETTRNI